MSDTATIEERLAAVLDDILDAMWDAASRPFTDNSYTIDDARTLLRALPAHNLRLVDAAQPDQWATAVALAYERGYHAGVDFASFAAALDTLDVEPEVVQWFHDSEEQCEGHDYDPPTCAVMADHFLRAFAVTPRLTERPDGTFRYESEHFARLHRAALTPEEPKP